MADWTEKYRPTTLAEVRGNDTARDELLEWAETWAEHREAVVVHGSPGIGKTSAAHALARDLGWGVVELNASDQRTADVIERIAGRAAENESIEAAMNRARASTEDDAEERAEAGSASDSDESGGDVERQLVILDEADNIHHQKDYGGQQALGDLIDGASQPIVLVANDRYDMSAGLRNAGREIEFRDVSARSIVPVLRDICRKEGIEYESAALEGIAERNSGDLRGAINDLQAMAESDRTLTEDDLVAGSRDRTQDIWTFLDATLKEESAEVAIRTAYDVDETPDSLVQWVEDKVPMVYDPDELARAYRFLAKADTWLGRVRATQDYSYWRYVTDDLAGGVAAARNRTRSGWTRYGGPPFRSSSNATRDYVARKVAETTGTSTATARTAILPYLAELTHHCKPRELTVAMAAAYDLEAEHVAFVTGSGESTNKVQDVVADAEALREEAAVEASGGAFEGGRKTEFGGGQWSDDGEDGTDEAAPGDDEEADTDDDEVDAEARAEAAEEDDGQASFADFT